MSRLSPLETGQIAPIRNFVADALGRDLARFEVAINGLVPIEAMSEDILTGEDVWSRAYRRNNQHLPGGSPAPSKAF